jgi:hypothetical protein
MFPHLSCLSVVERHQSRTDGRRATRGTVRRAVRRGASLRASSWINTHGRGDEAHRAAELGAGAWGPDGACKSERSEGPCDA